MKIIYLYARLMPYQVIVFKELIKSFNARVIAVSWPQEDAAPYVPEQYPGITYINKSSFKNRKELLKFVAEEKPAIIYCSGWMDPDYIYVAKHMKKTIPVVAGSDTIWKGNWKQRLNVLTSPLRHKKWFSHIWVAGSYQYEYARNLGFAKDKIIFNSLTADSELYGSFGKQNIKKNHSPHTFVFIGRFHPVKGISLMLEAFKEFKRLSHNDWKLICIGAGPMKEILCGHEDLEVIDFMGQQEICEMSGKFGVFLLPSISEPWGLVIHESASLGLPMLLTARAGANAMFLINGYNGYSFDPYSKSELVDRMLKITEKSDEELLQMGRNSFLLSSRITPQISAASLMSVLNM